MEKKTESLKNIKNDKIENIADSVCSSLFIDGIGKCRLRPSR
jgi:hypothetical protein